MKSYGITKNEAVFSPIDYHLENLKYRGYSINESLYSKEDCALMANLIYNEYSLQEEEFGRNNLLKINELNMCRMPFIRQKKLSDLFMNDLVIEVMEKYLGNAFHLHLQNAIINVAKEEHHQSSWHRDLPYQEWVISKPLAANAFFCLTDFTIENGATQLLPYSHNFEKFPSEDFAMKNLVHLKAKAGDVIFFDSMCYHKAGFNNSDFDRIGVNNVFVVPILKQQIDLASYAINSELNDNIKAVLGVNFTTNQTVNQFREKRLRKNEE